jgi:hypothetical protein
LLYAHLLHCVRSRFVASFHGYRVVSRCVDARFAVSRQALALRRC